MIRRIEARHFKGFKKIDIYLKPYNILVGPNATGKSTLLEIFTFLKDIFNQGPVSAVEKRCSSFSELVWNYQGRTFEIVLELNIPKNISREYQIARYEISLSTDENKGVIIENEYLWLIRKVNDKVNQKKEESQLRIVFPQESTNDESIVFQEKKKSPIGWKKVFQKSAKGKDWYGSELTGWNMNFNFGPTKASLAGVPEDPNRFPTALWVKKIFMEGIQFLQLNSQDMKWSCRPDAPAQLEPSGRNLPKVIRHLEENHKENVKNWIEHVKSALTDIE
jgi:energy-coupling factor transporter ATP-binding protein EcfA2